MSAGTKVDRTLEALEERFADDPVRADVVRRTRRFKSSWLELAEALVRVRREGLWRGWGYDDFGLYATRELSLRTETVEKLTGSYLFLQAKAPAVLARDGIAEKIPSYQSVDFLRRAEEQEGAPPDVVTELRRRVVDEPASHATLVRSFRSAVFPEEDAERDQKALEAAAARLEGLLEGTHAIDPELRAEARELLGRLLAALRGDA